MSKQQLEYLEAGFLPGLGLHQEPMLMQVHMAEVEQEHCESHWQTFQ